MLVNTIVSGNTGATAGTNGIVTDDDSGPVLSYGHNLIGTASGFSNFVATDRLNVDPRLGPLQDNGGVTPTHALLASSPAIDAGVASGQSSITDVKQVGGSVHLKFTSVSDKAYGLEYKLALSESSWTSLSELVVGTGGIVTVTNNETGLLSSQFYRAFERPP